MPGSPANIRQGAHLTLSVKGNRIVHLHGFVTLAYKWLEQGCPSVLIRTVASRTVDAEADFAFLPVVPANWPPRGRYVSPQPAAPPAPLRATFTTPTKSCKAQTGSGKTTFQISYLPALSGKTAFSHPKRFSGSLTETFSGSAECHPFNPLPPPPPAGARCTWKLHWSFVR